MLQDPRAFLDRIKPDADCDAPQTAQDGPQGHGMDLPTIHAADEANEPSAGSAAAFPRGHADAVIRASQCEGKVGFDSAAIAHKAARRHRQGEYRLEACRCSTCGSWHLGGPTPKALRRDREEKPRFKRPRNRNGVRQAWGQE